MYEQIYLKLENQNNNQIKTDDMIEINNVTYSYAGSSRRVFEDFSLNLESDKIYGLLGKNGMGKSTLLYLICGLLRPSAGNIKIEDTDINCHRPETLSEIFFVPEEFDLAPVSLDRYLATNMQFYPRFDRDVLVRCLNDFELSTDINLAELSMGQKKKVYMSFALAANTRYLFMDEPTNGLDIPSKSQFRKVVANSMEADRTIVISTHQVHDVEALLDHIMILDSSRLLLNSSVSDICNKYTFEHRLPGAPAEDVIYAEPSLQGNAVIAHRKEGGEDSMLNLELLFDAVTKGALKM